MIREHTNNAGLFADVDGAFWWITLLIDSS